MLSAIILLYNLRLRPERRGHCGPENGAILVAFPRYSSYWPSKWLSSVLVSEAASARRDKAEKWLLGHGYTATRPRDIVYLWGEMKTVNETTTSLVFTTEIS